MTSIIIPAYNAARTIEQCLASIFSQTYREFQVIIVDDGSADRTVAAAQNAISRWCNREIAARVVSQENRGAQAARNRGWREVQKRPSPQPSLTPEEGGGEGNYVLFCDADIVFRPDCLRKMVRALDEYPTASYAYSSFKFGWKKFTLWPFSAARLRQMPYIHTTSLIRAEHFPAAGFDESIKRFQDWDIWLTMLAVGHTGVWVPEALFTVVNTKGTMSRWVPAFLYKWPFKCFRLQFEALARYNEAVARIKEKHHLP